MSVLKKNTKDRFCSWSPRAPGGCGSPVCALGAPQVYAPRMPIVWQLCVPVRPAIPGEGDPPVPQPEDPGVGPAPARGKVCLGGTSVPGSFHSFIQPPGSLCSMPAFLSLENAGLVPPLKSPVLEACRPQVAFVSLCFRARRWGVGGGRGRRAPEG